MDLTAALELEEQVWIALQTGDVERDRSLLSDDFLGVYPSGVADRSGHTEQLADGPTVHDYRLSEARLVGLGEHQVLLSYRADWRRPSTADGGAPGPAEAMFISSIWAKRNERWVNTFSQDTPTTPDPAISW